MRTRSKKHFGKWGLISTSRHIRNVLLCSKRYRTGVTGQVSRWLKWRHTAESVPWQKPYDLVAYGSTVLYWLCITSRGNWRHVRAYKRWAVSLQHESSLERTGLGDSCIVYLTSDGGRYPSALKALFRIRSKPLSLKPGTQRSLFDQLYPRQVDIEIEGELDEAVPFQPFVPGLSFIRKPTHWGAYLQGHPMRQLKREDFAYLKSAILEADLTEDTV